MGVRRACAIGCVGRWAQGTRLYTPSEMPGLWQDSELARWVRETRWAGRPGSPAAAAPRAGCRGRSEGHEAESGPVPIKAPSGLQV